MVYRYLPKQVYNRKYNVRAGYKPTEKWGKDEDSSSGWRDGESPPFAYLYELQECYITVACLHDQPF